MDGLRVEWASDGEDFTGWFWVQLEAFEVKRDGEVNFTMKDVEPLFNVRYIYSPVQR